MGWVFVLVALGGAKAWGKSARELTTVDAVRHYQGNGTEKPVGIHVAGVVTYYDSVGPNLFVQDRTGGIWVDLRGVVKDPPQPGELVDLRGETAHGFTPYIANPSWKVVGHGAMPQPVRLTLDEAATGSYDSQWVELDGIVRSFSEEKEADVLIIDVATPTGSYNVRIPGYRQGFPMSLVDAKVRFWGVCGSSFNRRSQLISIHLLTSQIENSAVIEAAPANPYGIATTPISKIGGYSADLTEIHRVKVKGILTARFAGHGFFLMDQSGGMYAESQDGTPAEPGDELEVIGFPAAGEYSPVLKSATFLKTGRHQAIVPAKIDGKTALRGGYDAQLVTISGTVQGVNPASVGYTLNLQSADGLPYEVNFRPSGVIGQPPLPGSVVRLTGICSIKADGLGNPAAFQIVLRDAADLHLISAPPWLTSGRAALILGILVLISTAGLGWVIILRRRVRQQTGLIEIRLKNELALEERYRRMFERNLTGLYVASLSGSILDCNDACAQILGYADRLTLLEQHEQAERLTAQFQEQLDQSSEGAQQILNAERRIDRQDGQSRWVLANVRIVNPSADQPGCIECGLVDITDRKRAEEQVEFLAYNDSLTGLPNRRLLKDRLAQALAASKRHKEKLAILFLDLDRFKTINDSLGHSFGDLLLQEVARRIKLVMRDEDTVARLGGDEFLMVLTSLESAEDATVAAERIMEEMDRDFAIEGHNFKMSCSIGISVYPEHGGDEETLIKNADAAMYCAKEAGSQGIRFFTEDMNADLVERLTVENCLRLALAREEFYLVYQPEMRIADKKIIGMESLIRWQSPTLGLVPPDRFIHVAESSGLIGSIGEWVLKTACAQAKRWQDQGLEVMAIAVNVSAVQFRQENFCSMVRTVLEETGLSAECLELELTESLLLSAGEGMFARLAELKEMGVKLAIDDFGTGYSSLSYLRQFPVSKLKIDRSFIQDVAVSADAAAITAAIIELAKALSLKVIAEGVETEEQMKFLKGRQCDEIQGYFFSRPRTAQKMKEMLRESKPKES
jgi:diguanylate cyclase (GGDEF)-like protein/PAS domain S-box-containing protein